MNLKAEGGLIRTINPKRIISKFMVLKPYLFMNTLGTKQMQMVENAELHHSELTFKGRYVKNMKTVMFYF